MSAITKPEWRRRCIAHLRAHCGEDLREYKVARRSAASIEEDQAERGGKRKAERIDMSPDVTALTERLIALPRPDGCLHVFTSRDGNPYTEAAFTTLWQRIMTKAMEDKVIERRFTFHDLRAYYTTQHKDRYGGLPDIHANPATTSKVYDRSKVAKRRGL